MTHSLSGKTVAVLATSGFEQSELQEPKRLLESWGATVEVIAPGDDAQIRGWNHTDWGDSVPVDTPLAQAKPDRYDALVIVAALEEILLELGRPVTPGRGLAAALGVLG